jgi:hypothetical protein
MNLKIEEIIALLAWSIAYKDGMADAKTNASESEKNVVRAFRKCFSISTDRFNEVFGVDDEKLIAELAKQDPVSKMLGIYTCVAVGHAETEEGSEKGMTSDKEWDFIVKIIEAAGVSDFVRDAVRDSSKKLVFQLTDPELLDDDDISIDLLKLEIESGTFAEEYITPLLTQFFDAVEEENELLIWEENYLALKRNKRLLTKMFGEFSVKKWDDIYEDLKFNLGELKKSKPSTRAVANTDNAAAKEDLKKEKDRLRQEKEEEKERLRKEKEEEKERLRKEKENNKLAEKEKLNRTHEFSCSNGIMYCRYCGDLKENIRYDADCLRDYGHKYSVKRVERFSYDSKKEFEFKPVCSRCGKVGRCGSDWCN